jgi:hypothetical protein
MKQLNLDQRIAAAIRGELKTAAAVSDLIVEVDAAADQAVHDAAAANARAINPTILDPTAADTARAAELRAQRLLAARPPLRNRLSELLSVENMRNAGRSPTSKLKSNATRRRNGSRHGTQPSAQS